MSSCVTLGKPETNVPQGEPMFCARYTIAHEHCDHHGSLPPPWPLAATHPFPSCRAKYEPIPDSDRPDYISHDPMSSPPQIRSSLLETVERAFAFYDQDNSNSIDATEVVSILRALGHDPTRAESRALLRKANVDRNGGVEVGLRMVVRGE